MSFTCSYRGECEDDSDVVPYEPGESLPYRHYHWLSQCQAACHASDERELEYLVAEYGLHTMADIYSLAPSDRRDLVRRMTGTTVTEEDAFYALVLVTHPEDQYDYVDGDELLTVGVRYPVLWPRVLELDYQGDEAQVLLELGQPAILQLLKKQHYDLNYRRWRDYLKASEYDEETKEILFDEVESMFDSLQMYPTHAESDVPAFVALSYLLEDPRAAEWYEELKEDYRTYLIENGYEIDEEQWPFE